MPNVYEEMDQSDDTGAPPYVIPRRAVAPRSMPAPDNVYARLDAEEPQPKGTALNAALGQRNQQIAAFEDEAQKQFEQDPFLSAAQQEPGRAPPPPIAKPPPIVAAREENPSQPMGSGFAASAKSALVDDPETKRRILAQNLFPHDPDGIYRVGFDANGQPVYVGDDNKLHRVASGTAAFGANLAANSPEMLGAALGSGAGAGGAALGAAGMHGIKRGIAGLVYDEPQTIGQNLKGMAIEGVTAGVGEGIGRLGVGARNAGRMGIDFPADEIARADAVRQHVLATTRVNLNLADASDDPFIKAIYQYGWRQAGEPSRLLREGRAANDLEFNAATNRVLDQIASGEPSEVSGQRAVNAAQEAMRRAQTQANNIADPYYHAAWAAHPVVRDPNILRFLRYPGFEEAFNQGQVLAATENAALRPMQPPNLRSIDYWLRALRTQRDRIAGTATNPGDRELAGAMTQRIQELDNLTRASYPELQSARTVYATAHRALVEPLENGKVGALAQIDDADARKAASAIFSDPHVSAQHVADTRRAIEAVNPDAWRGVTRQWLASKWDESLQRTQSAEVRNPPGKFQAQVFGTPRDEEIARAMLTPQQYQDFDNLMGAARRLASTPVGGSTTPQDLAIGKALEGPINSVMQVVTSVRHPIQSAEDVARKAGRERNILNLTNAILDPAQRGRIGVITRMRPGRRQAALLGSLLSEETAKRYIQSRQSSGPNSKLVAGEEDDVGQ